MRIMEKLECVLLRNSFTFSDVFVSSLNDDFSDSMMNMIIFEKSVN